MRRWRLPSAKSEQDKLMPGGHRGRQCTKKGLTRILTPSPWQMKKKLNLAKLQKAFAGK
jgi:hypothetical protein